MALPGITKKREERKQWVAVRREADDALVGAIRDTLATTVAEEYLNVQQIDRLFNAAGMLRSIVDHITRLDAEIDFMEET